MAWFPDSNWLKALDIKGSVAAAVTVACIAILSMSELNWIYLGGLPTWAKAMLAVVAVFAFALFGSNLAQWLVDGYKASCRQRLKQKEQDKEEAKQERLRAEYRQQVLGYLDTLSEVEREILSFLVQKNQQSFTADMAGKLIATLKQKGLVEMGPGVHTQLDWPFTVPNFVWEELMRRKEDFNIADLEGRVPWREQW